MKELKITIPEGMEIDKENSTFECIKFKPIKSKRWRENTKLYFAGYYIDEDSEIHYTTNATNINCNYNVFATEKQAKSALAMAYISQIMVNDERFGGVVTDEEWNENDLKCCIIRKWGNINKINSDIELLI